MKRLAYAGKSRYCKYANLATHAFGITLGITHVLLTAKKIPYNFIFQTLKIDTIGILVLPRAPEPTPKYYNNSLFLLKKQIKIVVTRLSIRDL